MTSVKGMIEARVKFVQDKLGLIGKMVKEDVSKAKGKSPQSTGSMLRSRREFLEARNSRILEINSAMMEEGKVNKVASKNTKTYKSIIFGKQVREPITVTKNSCLQKLTIDKYIFIYFVKTMNYLFYARNFFV